MKVYCILVIFALLPASFCSGNWTIEDNDDANVGFLKFLQEGIEETPKDEEGIENEETPKEKEKEEMGHIKDMNEEMTKMDSYLGNKIVFDDFEEIVLEEHNPSMINVPVLKFLYGIKESSVMKRNQLPIQKNFDTKALLNQFHSKRHNVIKLSLNHHPHQMPFARWADLAAGKASINEAEKMLKEQLELLSKELNESGGNLDLVKRIWAIKQELVVLERLRIIQSGHE